MAVGGLGCQVSGIFAFCALKCFFVVHCIYAYRYIVDELNALSGAWLAVGGLGCQMSGIFAFCALKWYIKVVH